MKASIAITFIIPCVLASSVSFADDMGTEIIVTSTRSPQPAKSYAGSVSVIGPEQLRTTALVHPSELLNQSAGVNIHRNSGQEHLTAIRSPVLTGGAGAGSFLYLEDGVPIRAAGFGNVNGLFESAIDMAGGVEITKGPGSVLYGSNAVHGLINILSVTPTDNRDLTVDVLGNDNGYARVKLTGNGSAFSGRFHAGLNLAHSHGFRDDSGFDQQKIQIRHDSNTNNWSINTVFNAQNLNQETAGFIQGISAYKDKGLSSQNPNPEAFRDGQSVRLAVHMDRQLSRDSSVSFIPYTRWTELSFLRHFVPGKALEDSGHHSFGLLTKYDKTIDDRHYILGLDVDYTDGFVKEFQAGPRVFSFISGEHFDYKVKALSLAPYLQADFQFRTYTTLSASVRADYTHYDYDNKISSGQFGRFIRADDRSDDYLTIAPKLSLTHDFSAHWTGYARAARGNRAPQISDAYSLQINQTAGAIKPETLDSLELGLKGYWAGTKIDAAVFTMRKENFFFRNANGFNVVDGQTNHLGAELSFNTALTEIFELSGSFTLARHTYDFTDTVSGASSSITAGSRVDSAPDTLGFLQITARPHKSLTTRFKWQHAGQYYTDPGNTKTYPGHNVFIASANYALSDTIDIYGRVDNVFDARYADRADFAFGNERYFPGRPRTLFFGVRFTQ